MAIITGYRLTQLAIVSASYCLVKYGPNSGFFARSGYFGSFAILSSGALALWLVYLRVIWPIWLTPLAKLPQPKGGSWINGHLMKILMAGTGEVERKWIHEIPNDGFIYYRHILNTARLIVSLPETVQEICTRTDEFVKPSAANAIAGRILGEGLVLSEHDMHRQQRRIFLPIFAPRHIRDMFPIFWAKACEVTQKLTDEALEKCKDGDAVFEIGNWASRAALDIVCMATIGEDFGSIADEDALLAKTYRQAIEPSRAIVVLCLLKLWLPVWFVDMMPTKFNNTMDESVPVIRNLCRRLLRERRQQHAEKSSEGKDLLSLCFRYEEVASAPEEGVIDQMTTFLAAGHETISVGITWSIYMLCLHPEWQAILRQEARANLPDPNKHSFGTKDQAMATSADVENMPMTQAFINEVLRWYPPIPQTIRETLKDTVVRGQMIPKGTWIIIPFKGLHRDERFWGPDAHKFNPRRWLHEDGTLNATGGCTNKYVNMTFNQGHRSCVAQGFSKAEMACVIAAWTGRFAFELVHPDMRDEEKMPITIGSFSARPLNGLDVKWTIVEGWEA